MAKATDVSAKAVTTAGSSAGESTNLVTPVGDVTKLSAGVDVHKPLPVPEGGWPADEFTGLGGDYVRDPLTGKRSPAVPAV